MAGLAGLAGLIHIWCRNLLPVSSPPRGAGISGPKDCSQIFESSWSSTRRIKHRTMTGLLWRASMLIMFWGYVFPNHSLQPAWSNTETANEQQNLLIVERQQRADHQWAHLPLAVKNDHWQTRIPTLSQNIAAQYDMEFYIYTISTLIFYPIDTSHPQKPTTQGLRIYKANAGTHHW